MWLIRYSVRLQFERSRVQLSAEKVYVYMRQIQLAIVGRWLLFTRHILFFNRILRSRYAWSIINFRIRKHAHLIQIRRARIKGWFESTILGSAIPGIRCTIALGISNPVYQHYSHCRKEPRTPGVADPRNSGPIPRG